MGPIPLPPLPLVAYAPLPLPSIDWYWNVELGVSGGVIGLLSINVIGSSSSMNLVDWLFVLALLSLEVSCGLLDWN